MMNAMNDMYEMISIFGDGVLFTESKIDRNTIPESYYVYDIRDDGGDGIPHTIELIANVDRFGTIITNRPIDLGKDGFRCIEPYDYGFLGEAYTLQEYIDQYPPFPSVSENECEVENGQYDRH